MSNIQYLKAKKLFMENKTQQKISHEKTGNVPNLTQGGRVGTPPLFKYQTVSVFFI